MYGDLVKIKFYLGIIFEFYEIISILELIVRKNNIIYLKYCFRKKMRKIVRVKYKFVWKKKMR